MDLVRKPEERLSRDVTRIDQRVDHVYLGTAKGNLTLHDVLCSEITHRLVLKVMYTVLFQSDLPFVVYTTTKLRPSSSKTIAGYRGHPRERSN